MKNQIFGVLFYLLYLLAMVRPLIPIMEYYANYDYIATVLCENRDKPFMECNGKCYLEKQIKKVNHQDHDHKSTIPLIDFEKYPITLLDQNSYELNTCLPETLEARFKATSVYQEYNFELLKPPRV